MKYAKTFGLLAIAAAAFMAFAGSASATITSPTGTTYNGELHATSTNLELTGGLQIGCAHSSVRGQIENGNTTGTISSLTISGCNRTMHVIDEGDLKIESNGTVRWTGAQVTMLADFIFFKVHCIYKTNDTDIGTLTDSHDTGSTAVLDFNAIMPQAETDSSCGENSEWHGLYTITTPDNLYID